MMYVIRTSHLDKRRSDKRKNKKKNPAGIRQDEPQKGD